MMRTMMQDHCLSSLFVTASSSSYLFIQVSFLQNNDETDEVKMTQSKEYTPRVKNNGQEKETTITYCSWWECLPSCLFSCLPFQLKRKEVMRQDHRRSLFIITTLFSGREKKFLFVSIHAFIREVSGLLSRMKEEMKKTCLYVMSVSKVSHLLHHHHYL